MTRNKNILIKNIYYMLAYACNMLRLPIDCHRVDMECFENIHDMLALMLVMDVSAICQQGLYSDYVANKGDLSTVRGKINIGDTITNHILHRHLVNCEYDEISPDNLYNRIIKSTIDLLVDKADLAAEYKKKLKALQVFFADVSDINLDSVKWEYITYNHDNNRYQTAIIICQLLYRGMLPATCADGNEIKKFFKETLLNTIYEKFVLNYYKKEFRGRLSVTAPHIMWQADDGNTAMLPRMETDIVLCSADKTLIIDAKYYSKILIERNHGGKKKFHAGNLYQIFSYVKNKETQYNRQKKKNYVGGMLLYAQTEIDDPIDSDYSLCGNPISVKTLDLNTDFDTIKRQLNNIVKAYFNIEPGHRKNKH